jgi:hypothetical protein
MPWIAPFVQPPAKETKEKREKSDAGMRCRELRAV